MRIAGSHRLTAPRARSWDALHDPEVLRTAIPGIERLEARGPSEFAIAMRVGVGPIVGSYAGTLSITDSAPGSACSLRASASGARGSVTAEVEIQLEGADGGTDVAYEADAAVTGPVAAVGQRMIAAVARRLAAQFFTAVDAAIAGGEPVGGAATAPVVAAATPVVSEAAPGRSGFRLDGWSVLAGFVLAVAAMLIGHFL